jgi:hypothetical protein
MEKILGILFSQAVHRRNLMNVCFWHKADIPPLIARGQRRAFAFGKLNFVGETWHARWPLHRRH